MIDLKTLRQDLEETERGITEGRAQIARQRKIIIQLAHNGSDTSTAVADMKSLLDSQRLYERRHRRVLRDLSRLKEK